MLSPFSCCWFFLSSQFPKKNVWLETFNKHPRKIVFSNLFLILSTCMSSIVDFMSVSLCHRKKKNCVEGKSKMSTSLQGRNFLKQNKNQFAFQSTLSCWLFASFYDFLHILTIFFSSARLLSWKFNCRLFGFGRWNAKGEREVDKLVLIDGQSGSRTNVFARFVTRDLNSFQLEPFVDFSRDAFV